MKLMINKCNLIAMFLCAITKIARLFTKHKTIFPTRGCHSFQISRQKSVKNTQVPNSLRDV